MPLMDARGDTAGRRVVRMEMASGVGPPTRPDLAAGSRVIHMPIVALSHMLVVSGECLGAAAVDPPLGSKTERLATYLLHMTAPGPCALT
jgi:hypothetical protein